MRIMKQELRIKNILEIIALVSIMLYSLFFIYTSSAQVAPQFMITWKANAYAPSDFQGKVLPNGNTVVDLAVELIDSNRLVNLSQNEIRWYVNNTLIASGRGLKTTTYVPTQFTRGSLTVRVEIRDYRGAHREGRIAIPVVDPQVVIEIPRPNNRIAPEIHSFRALPYFFNITSLSQLGFTWSINGAEAGGIVEDPALADVDATGLPSGFNLTLNVLVNSLIRQIEVANNRVSIIVQ